MCACTLSKADEQWTLPHQVDTSAAVSMGGRHARECAETTGYVALLGGLRRLSQNRVITKWKCAAGSKPDSEPRGRCDTAVLAHPLHQQWEYSERCLCLHGEVAASEQYFVWELAVGISARNQPQFIQPTGQNQMLLEEEVCVWEGQLSDNLVLRGTSFWCKPAYA